MNNIRTVLPLVAIATVLAGCKTVPEAPPGPVATRTKTVTETTVHTLPAATAVAMLHTDITKGTLIVELNGAQVGKVGPHQELNIAKYVQPGRNTMTLRWTKPVAATGHVTMGPSNARVSQVIHFTLTPGQTIRPGEDRLTFETPSTWR